jgi:Polysaccharide lyase
LPASRPAGWPRARRIRIPQVKAERAARTPDHSCGPMLPAAPTGRCRVVLLVLAIGALVAVLAAARSHTAVRPLGSVVFTGDFETGNLSQWTWGAQCANTGVPSAGSTVRGKVSVQSETVAQGRYAARFDLPPAASGFTACETLVKRRIGLGRDDYYGLMVRFPSDWRKPSPVGWGLSLAQLNFERIWGAPLMLVAHANRVALVMQSGLCKTVHTSKPGCAYSSGPNGNVAPMTAVPAPLALGVWHELIMHVRWTVRSSGIIEVWHRLHGGRGWKKTASRRGYPTVQWTPDHGPKAIVRSVTSDKIGAYRGRADFPLTVWQDGFVRTTSFAAAAAALP